MPKKRKETIVERRLKEGARIMKTATRDAATGVIWTFADTGKTARADICERLVADGVLAPLNDGLFPGESQTWGLA